MEVRHFWWTTVLVHARHTSKRPPDVILRRKAFHHVSCDWRPGTRLGNRRTHDTYSRTQTPNETTYGTKLESYLISITVQLWQKQSVAQKWLILSYSHPIHWELKLPFWYGLSWHPHESKKQRSYFVLLLVCVDIYSVKYQHNFWFCLCVKPTLHWAWGRG